MTILELQTALIAAKFDPGPADGIAGPKTRQAVREFQAKNGLEVDGIAGPKTLAKLLGKSKMPTSAQTATAVSMGDVPSGLPWLSEAKRLIGTTEVAGAADNGEIMDWAKQTHIGFGSDETPWCGLFISHCIASTLPNEPMPANPLGARNWLKFGTEVSPQYGAVLVFWRGSQHGALGHVAFYWAEDDTHFHILGGNQSNAVNVMRIAKSRLLGARWPKGAAPRGMRRFITGSSVAISENEA